MNTRLLRPAVATAPTVYGIETNTEDFKLFHIQVATAPTVYGIETKEWILRKECTQLQQHLPFTVLKLFKTNVDAITVIHNVATAPTVYGIETLK